MKTFRAISFPSLAIGILGFLVACGSELPVKELAEAKTAITRAKEAGAEKYASGEFEEARKSLLTAHEKASNEDLGETKKSAEYAKNKAYDALEKSYPSLTEESKKQAGAAIDEADEAFASQLAAEPFNNAVELRKEGDTLRDSADRTLESYPKESNDDAKVKTRLAAFEQYEQSNKKYLESKKSAADAKALALSQKQQLIDSLSDIEKNLDDADRYAGGQDPEVAQTRERLNAAKSKIDSGKIKEGYSEVDDIRKKSAELVAKNIQSYAAKKKEEAKESIGKAKGKLASIDQSKLKTSKDLQTSYQRADENLKAADESLVAAEDLYTSEKYEDSIGRSEEAIRLSRIVVDQSDDIAERIRTGSSVAGRKTGGESTEGKTGGKEEGTHASSGELPEGWKKYVVRKKVPADCLWRIAAYKQHYGTSRLWRRIYQANKGKIKNPNLIYPKQVLLIPPAKGPIKYDPKKAPKKTTGSDKVEAATAEEKKKEEKPAAAESSEAEEEEQPAPQQDSPPANSGEEQTPPPATDNSNTQQQPPANTGEQEAEEDR